MERAYRRPRRRVRRVLLVFILLLAAAAAFLWSEQNWLQTQVIAVPSDRLPEAFDGFRIVQISDVHGKEFGTDNEALLKAVAALKPDVIAVTGDLIDRPAHLEMVPALARGLSDIAPTYYVTGNHEWAVGNVSALRALLRENGVKPLSNEYEVWERDGQTLVLAGIDDPNGPADQKTPDALVGEIRDALGDPFIVLFAHRNNKWEIYDRCGVDLAIVGHAHGGMVRLPFTDGLIGPFHEFFPKYTAGLYEFPNSQLMVSRGLGGGTALQIRVFNRPHLPVIVLEGK